MFNVVQIALFQLKTFYSSSYMHSKWILIKLRSSYIVIIAREYSNALLCNIKLHRERSFPNTLESDHLCQPLNLIPVKQKIESMCVCLYIYYMSRIKLIVNIFLNMCMERSQYSSYD